LVVRVSGIVVFPIPESNVVVSFDPVFWSGGELSVLGPKDVPVVVDKLDV
jgi:hypothetical protein